MVFTSLKFAAFFAAIFILYYLLPARYQRYLLLAGSYVFYAFTSVKALFMLLSITLITYLGAYFISRNYGIESDYLQTHDLEKDEKKAYKAIQAKKRKQLLTVVIVALLGILFVFKYTNFAIYNIGVLANALGANATFSTLNILLPVGLSFYIFQTMGYVIDVYRGSVEAEQDISKYALFASYFPQIMQGPIGDYSKLAPQLYSEHAFDYDKAVRGLQRIIWGVFKKLVIANNINMCLNLVFSSYWTWHGFIWIIALCMYSIELYADFSGYMDIAIGCSEMLGISLEENFEVPYFAKNVADFWRRWHITLGACFRNYVFYPLLRSKWLDGMRKKYKKAGKKQLSTMLPTVIALAITWFLTGAWHGASWSYILYGVYYGIFLIMDALLASVYSNWQEKHQKLSDSKLFNCFRVVRTFTIVTLGYSIFRPANLTATVYILGSMFSGLYKSEVGKFLYTYYYYIIAAVIGTIVLTLVDVYHLKNTEAYSLRNKILTFNPVIRYLIYIVSILAIIFMGAYGDASLNSFAYFQF